MPAAINCWRVTIRESENRNVNGIFECGWCGQYGFLPIIAAIILTFVSL
ncbi:MAG: hypothetical protein LBV41_11760 [Cytophagaceae bacterium]|nr:hypothetical protein [Cytophagaceae bacterium]